MRRAAPAAALALLLAVLPGCGGGGGGASYHEPKGPAQTTLTVAAGNFFFRPGVVTGPAGIDLVELVGKGGSHTLAIDGVSGFELSVGGDGEKASAKVKFAPGNYTFYCTIPGHRDAGMEGTFKIS